MTQETVPSQASHNDEPIHESEQYSAEDLEQLQIAAEGAEDVLQLAIESGEPHSDIVDTDEGRKGYVDANIPGGKVEGLFDGTGPDARLERVDILVQDDNHEEHDVSVKLGIAGDQAEILLDGQPARPEDVPAVAMLIEHIRQSQADKDEASDEPSSDGPSPSETVGDTLQEAIETTGDLASIEAQLDSIGSQLDEIGNSLESFGDAFEKFAQVLQELVKFLEAFAKAVEEINKESDEQKKKELKADLQKKVDEFAAKIQEIANSL